MKVHNILKSATLLFLFPAILAFGAAYNDVANDLSNDHNNPTTFAVAAGANTITGKFTATNDYDYVKFTVPAGHVLGSIFLTAYNNPGSSTSFMAIGSGASIALAPPNPGTAVGLLGYAQPGAGMVGTDILDNMGAVGNGSTGFSGSLPTGTYTLWLQDFNNANTTYTLTLNIVPLANVQAPILAPLGGSFFDAVEVTMTSATSGATIYYTTDGTTPNTGDILYTGPFTLTQTTTVKAYAIKNGSNDSTVTTQDYTVSPSPVVVVPAPTLTVSGKKSIKTTKASVKIKGSATNATSVEYKVGKGSFKAATGTTAWSFNAKLKPGKNVILIQAIGEEEDSAPAKVTATYLKKK